MALEYALLGLLAEKPASGYELTQRFERGLRRYAWHAQHSQIYPELGRLADQGLIRVVEEGARGRRTYAITRTGRSALRAWLLGPMGEPVVRNELVLRLFLISTLSPADARTVLEPLVKASAREAQALRDALKTTEKAHVPGTPLPFGLLAAEFGVRSYEALHDWAVWAMGKLA